MTAEATLGGLTLHCIKPLASGLSDPSLVDCSPRSASDDQWARLSLFQAKNVEFPFFHPFSFIQI